MSMVVQHNEPATRTLNILNENSNALTKSLKKASTGQRITGAGDDASGYGISERMRSLIRVLAQDKQNTENGTSLFKVAEGGIQSIIDELRNLKELALNSANDTNTDKDRATLQRDFEHKIANINDIASTTNYNGKYLLDGTYKGDMYGTAGAGGSSSASKAEPSGTPIVISGGNYTVASDGAYEFARGYSGTVTISAGAKNVKFQQADSSTALSEVYINGPSGGGANIWIDGLNIKSVGAASVIKFQGADNYLTIKNDNTIALGGVNGRFVNNIASAMINVGGGLTIEHDSYGSLTVDTAVNDGIFMRSAIIGSDFMESSTGNITINGGKFNINPSSGYFAGAGAHIGSGAAGSVGDITINGGEFDLVTWGGGACIGTGAHSRASTAGNIEINNAKITAKCDDGACIGSGSMNSTVGDIYINNSIINVQNITDPHRSSSALASFYVAAGYGAGIGSGVMTSGHSATAGDITITNSDVTATSVGGEAIGKGYGSSVGSVSVSLGNPTIGSDAAVFRPLIIHHGEEANQATKFYINDMHTWSLGIDGTSMTTRAKATRAIDKIDKAIDYALNEMTSVGSYLSRLEHTGSNITTASENTRAAESTIRDADMAREMTEYTKNNVLLQAAQAMLAQANQDAGAALGLLG